MHEFDRSKNVIERDVGNDPSKVIGIKIETIQDNHAPIIQVCKYVIRILMEAISNSNGQEIIKLYYEFRQDASTKLSIFLGHITKQNYNLKLHVLSKNQFCSLLAPPNASHVADRHVNLEKRTCKYKNVDL